MGGGETVEQTEPRRHISPSAHLFSVTHTLKPNVNTLGLWQQCVCFFVLLDVLCRFGCIDALANEAHNEVCQQLLEDAG